MSSTTSTTFPVSDVAPATTPLPETPYKEAVEALLKADLLGAALGGGWFGPGTGLKPSSPPRPLEACASYDGRLVSGVPFHPFVAAVHRAFMDHRPLRFSPDAVWLLICQGVANHINAHAEELRHRLVSHQGKARIHVRRDDFVKGSPENPWGEVIDAFLGQVREQVGPSIDLFLPAFTTTGPAERVAAGVVLLDAVRSYFSYDLETLCGIPSVTLEGTPEDWQAVADRAEQFGPLGLEWWLRPLREVLAQFVAAAQGVVDRPFWRSLYKHLDDSGGPAITGWISAFFPYLKDSRTGEVTWRNPWLSLDCQRSDIDEDEYDFDDDIDVDEDDLEDIDSSEEGDDLDDGVSELDEVPAPGRDDAEDSTVLRPRERPAPKVRRVTDEPPDVTSDQDDLDRHREDDLDEDLEDDLDEDLEDDLDEDLEGDLDDDAEGGIDWEREREYGHMMWVWLNPIPRRERGVGLDRDGDGDAPDLDCGPKLADLPSGLSKAPFRWHFLDQTVDMELLGGFVGVAQDRETLAVKPEIGLVVREAPAVT
jgi:hypothetical protein